MDYSGGQTLMKVFLYILMGKWKSIRTPTVHKSVGHVTQPVPLGWMVIKLWWRNSHSKKGSLVLGSHTSTFKDVFNTEVANYWTRSLFWTIEHIPWCGLQRFWKFCLLHQRVRTGSWSAVTRCTKTSSVILPALTTGLPISTLQKGTSLQLYIVGVNLGVSETKASF